MSEYINTLIIGAGQAGLSLSYYLTQQRRPHVILEDSSQVAHAWRDQRWELFYISHTKLADPFAGQRIHG